MPEITPQPIMSTHPAAGESPVTLRFGTAEHAITTFERIHRLTVTAHDLTGTLAPSPSLRSAARMPATPWPKSPWARNLGLPAAVDDDEAQLILEHLRQLAARLSEWAGRRQPVASQKRRAPDAFTGNSLTRRQVAILRFIEEYHTSPASLAMLAKRLCLSESRTSHVVRQACKASFRDLLIDRRLRAAMELLRDSGMSVLQVAMACGFEDVAHFHRLFRRRIGLTPAQYRTSGRS